MSALKLFWIVSFSVIAALFVLARWWPDALWAFVVVGPLFLVGARDSLQSSHSVLRNFPVIGHFRYLFEAIRPEIQQYFVESETSGRPFSRELRSVVYQRSKDVNDTRPFGTVRDLYEVGSEWIPHSLKAVHPPEEAMRVLIGAGVCSQPYSASLLNVSAMSFGSLSNNAVRALNRGARLGGFAHNTGEGGLSPYHLENGGDIVWQIGTGYFGCRTAEGGFDEDRFRERAGLEQVRMIEIKLSQGAKPGHGGILPAEKVTEEIAEIRGVPLGQDVLSPPTHRAFDTPAGLIRFVEHLREISGGKPVGFKLCVGRLSEFLGICKAMLERDSTPDFITVDGSEGGTGAAPLEFSNTIGLPLTEGLLVVHNALVGCGLRDRVKIIASGKIVTGFNIIQRIAIGADLCNSARGMMFALGCIQAMRCNTNHCPVGVATQDPDLVRGLVPSEKSMRVHNFHKNSVESAMEMLGAAGLTSTEDLRPEMIYRRTSPARIQTYAQIYDYIEPGALADGARFDGDGPYAHMFQRSWDRARSDRF